MIEFDFKRTGMLIVVSAPSGGGKSTIIRALLASSPNLSYSISATTRQPRGPEKHGVDYYFYSLEQFEKMIQQDLFYEHALVHGSYYGTLKSEVDAKLEAGLDVILDIDVQGSIELKKKMPDCTSIFILPPSMAALEKRLRERGQNTEEDIERRLRNARGELRMADQYDYILLNRDLEATIENTRMIIAAQRFRSSRLTIKDGFGSVLISASGES